MAYISFQPTDFFLTNLWAGSGSNPRTFTDVGFQPDLTWLKARDGAQYHYWYDAVRTAGVSNEISSSYNGTQGSLGGTTGYLSAFTAIGFTVTEGSSNDNVVNDPAMDYVAWTWKAGTTTGIAGSPSITPTSYSFNQTCGFSIIKYEGNGIAGATIPHGLGAAPHFILTKSLDAGNDWGVYHKGMNAAGSGVPTTPEDYAMKFNSTGARADQVAMWNDTAPSATLVTLGTEGRSNDTNSMIAYCFTEKKGYSRFSSYFGNGNIDSPMVYCGFSPAFVILKKTSATGAWIAFDNKRPFNTSDFEKPRLVPSATSTESFLGIDFLANGFKLRETDSDINGSGVDYCFIAFAEFPIVSSNDIPATAK